MIERKTRIKQFLSRSFRNHQIQDDEDIFSLGFVNSLLALQLVTFIQNEFAVTIEDEDLDFENFRTVNAMNALVELKLNSHAEV